MRGNLIIYGTHGEVLCEMTCTVRVRAGIGSEVLVDPSGTGTVRKQGVVSDAVLEWGEGVLTQIPFRTTGQTVHHGDTLTVGPAA